MKRFAFFLLCHFGLLSSWAQDPARPPNIIFILADDWGWGDLGSHGNKRIKTPHLDRLAAEGTDFRQFYANAAVCSPSRASFLTGLFPRNHGIEDHLRGRAFNLKRGLPPYLGPNLPLLPKILRGAGYATAHYGKWHLTSPDDPLAPTPDAYGFDDHRLTLDAGDGIHFQPPGVSGWKVWDAARIGHGAAWDAWRSCSSKLIIDEALSFIETNRDRPFYVETWLYDTHGRLTPTEEQKAEFPQLGEPYRIYYGALQDSDRQIGRILQKLDELGLAEDTLVIFSSDNGPEDGAIGDSSAHGVGDAGPFRGRKRSGYEGGIRTPFLVRWPGVIPAGRVDTETVVSGVDLLPTLSRLAGGKVPARGDGEDLSRAFLGEPASRTKPLYWYLPYRTAGSLINRSPQLIIREGKWKLLMNPDGTGAELYDIPLQSLEVDNLASEHPEVASVLSRKLLDWNKR